MSGGAAAAAPALCKTDGCTRPVRGRGMCINCYEKWRRVNPHRTVTQVNMQTIEDLLPSWSVKKLAETTGFTMDTVQKILDRLHAAGRARIVRYASPEETGWQWKPVWDIGQGAHASRPMMAIKARAVAQNRISGRDRKKKPASWAGPLGV